MPLSTVAITFGGRLSTGMLIGGVDNAIGVPLAIKVVGGLPSGMPLGGGGADNAIGGPYHQPGWRASFRDAVGRRAVAGGLGIKFGGCFPDRMLMAGGSAYNAVEGPCHQVWWRFPCWNVAG